MFNTPSGASGPRHVGITYASLVSLEIWRELRANEPIVKLLRRGAGKVELRLNLREDLYRWWRALEHVHRRSALPGPFVAFLAAWPAFFTIFRLRPADT